MREREKTIVALGSFDGVHLGHRELIRRTVEIAGERNAVACVYTFANHPAQVLGGSVRLLSTMEERRAALESLGVSQVHMEPFTRELAKLTPVQFIEKLLAQWDVSGLVVGYNYTFGAFGAGTPDTLETLGKEYGFTVDVVPPVLYLGEPVSSTRIRDALEAGDVETTAAMLTHPYTLSGPVIANRRIGRRIGFPTANIAPASQRVMPGNGVYGTAAQVEGCTYAGVTNLGTNPTVGGKTLSVETHLLGFDGDLYGRELAVSFLFRVRGERTFPGVEALKEQIARDAETVEKRLTP